MLLFVIFLFFLNFLKKSNQVYNGIFCFCELGNVDNEFCIMSFVVFLCYCFKQIKFKFVFYLVDL